MPASAEYADALADAVAGLRMDGPTPVLCDSAEAVEALLATLLDLPPERRRLYLDCEGIDLCRHGRLCIGQLSYAGAGAVYLLDYVTLPDALRVEAEGTCLADLLESPEWVKYFFDPRNDCDAMHAQCGGVVPRNVICLQLAEVATDRAEGEMRRMVNGLARVLDTRLPHDKRARVNAIKAAGKALFAPERGGSYDVFVERPLAASIVEYCCADVAYFEFLEAKLYAPLDAKWKAWVAARSEERVAMCRRPQYWGNGRQNALAPN